MAHNGNLQQKVAEEMLLLILTHKTLLTTRRAEVTCSNPG